MATTDLKVELVREERPNDFRSVTLTLDKDGVAIHTYDIGKLVEKFFGHDDYEFTARVATADLGKLVVALLAQTYRGNANATDDFEAFCKANDIPCRWDSWP